MIYLPDLCIWYFLPSFDLTICCCVAAGFPYSITDQHFFLFFFNLQHTSQFHIAIPHCYKLLRLLSVTLDCSCSLSYKTVNESSPYPPHILRMILLYTQYVYKTIKSANQMLHAVISTWWVAVTVRPPPHGRNFLRKHRHNQVWQWGWV